MLSAGDDEGTWGHPTCLGRLSTAIRMGVQHTLRPCDHASENGSQSARPWCGMGLWAVLERQLTLRSWRGQASRHGRTLLRHQRVCGMGGALTQGWPRGCGSQDMLRTPTGGPSPPVNFHSCLRRALFSEAPGPPGTLCHSRYGTVLVRASPPTPGRPPTTMGFAPRVSYRVQPLTHRGPLRVPE